MCRLSDICTFFSGGTPSSSNKDFYGGNIPFIRSGELHKDETELFITQSGYDYSSAKMVEVGDLLLAMYGATSGDIAISKINGAINQAILCIRTKQNKKFIESVWNKHVSKILMKYLQGGQGNLSADIVKCISFSIPSLVEQDKISHLMQLLDARIATQNKVIEDLKKLKCAIIETEYNDKGQECRIGDIIEQTSLRNKSNLVKTVLSVNNKLGFINQDEQFEDRTVASEDTSNYKVVKKDDFAYNPARINVGSIARLKSFEEGIVSPMYICFKVTNGIFPEYLESYFATSQFSKEMQKRLEGSVRLCLSFESLCNIPIVIPCMNEQAEISKRIDLLENKIETECKILSQYGKQKQYLLRQMFI